MSLLEMQDAKNRQKFAVWTHRTILSGYIFAKKAHIDNRKNMLNSNISRTCPPQYMVNFGPEAAEIVSLVWGTPANFNRVSHLGNVTAQHELGLVGVSETLRR